MRPTRVLTAFLALMLVFPAMAQAKTVKVGVLLPYSWVNKNNADQTQKGIDLYVKLHGDMAGGNKIVIIKKDTTGPKPPVAGRAAQELVTRDKVDILTGVIYSNNAFRIAAIVNKAKVPLLIMNAGAAALTKASPYIARFSFTMWHAGYVMGEQAASRMGFKKVITLFSNYAPGKDSALAFKTGFERKGGKVIEDIPIPFPKFPDLTPFLQRVKDAKPDALYVFVPAGKTATVLMKTYSELGLKKAGVVLIGPGDLTTDEELKNMGQIPVGLVTAHHYSAAHPSAVNKAFVAAWKKAYGPDSTPNFMSAAAWDTMAAIYQMVEKLNGDITAEKAMAFLKGWTYDSPRGPIMIDPKTRDIVQNVYMRIVDVKNGKLQNTEFQTFPRVKDMCKELKIGKCK